MAEYIDRNDALAIVRYAQDKVSGIENLPAADVMPVVHGRNLNDTPSLFECSVCNWSDWDTCTGDTGTYNYCPNCGAHMKDGDTNA